MNLMSLGCLVRIMMSTVILYLTPNITFNPEFTISQIFATKKKFKMAVKFNAKFKLRRNIHFSKNDCKRIYTKCCEETCKWKIHALKMKNEFSFQIRKMNLKHTCAPSQKVRSLSSSWLMEKFLQKFQSDENRKVSVFIEDVIHI